MREQGDVAGCSGGGGREWAVDNSNADDTKGGREMGGVNGRRATSENTSTVTDEHESMNTYAYRWTPTVASGRA